MYKDLPASNLSPNSSTLIVYGYDSSTGQYIPTATLESGKGYWLAVSSDADISLSKTGSSDIPFALNKVIGSDFLQSFSELPPLPPALQNVKLSDNETIVPKEFKLLQNYPNPFNPYTKIEYEIPKTANVTLKIYNILGQEIKTLIDNEQQPGNYQITWDGTNNYNIHVASGVYIYQIRAGSFIQTKKMVFLR